MTEVIIITGIPMLFVSFLSFTQLPSWLNFKPFNCHVCSSFWAALILLFISHQYPTTTPHIEMISYAGMASYAAIVFKRLLTII